MSTSKLSLLFIIIVTILSGCQGDMGPEGPQGSPGPQGPQGPQTVGFMHEVSFTLNGANKWETFYTFPTADKVLETDIVLVYLLWEVQKVGNTSTDVWRLMPVNYFYKAGLLSINYDFSRYDVRIFAEAAFTLDPSVDIYKDMIARIVVIPVDASPNKRKAPVNYENFEEVKAAYGLKETSLLKGKPLNDIMEALKSKGR